MRGGGQKRARVTTIINSHLRLTETRRHNVIFFYSSVIVVQSAVIAEVKCPEKSCRESKISSNEMTQTHNFIFSLFSSLSHKITQQIAPIIVSGWAYCEDSNPVGVQGSKFARLDVFPGNQHHVIKIFGCGNMWLLFWWIISDIWWRKIYQFTTRMCKIHVVK